MTLNILMTLIMILVTIIAMIGQRTWVFQGLGFAIIGLCHYRTKTGCTRHCTVQHNINNNTRKYIKYIRTTEHVISLSLYIYICIQRERHKHVSAYVYIYIYIHMCVSVLAVVANKVEAAIQSRGSILLLYYICNSLLFTTIYCTSNHLLFTVRARR